MLMGHTRLFQPTQKENEDETSCAGKRFLLAERTRYIGSKNDLYIRGSLAAIAAALSFAYRRQSPGGAE